MTSPIYDPICMECRHFRRDVPGYTCEAFPEGIPEPIIDSEVSHLKPYPGDNAIQFERDTSAEPTHNPLLEGRGGV